MENIVNTDNRRFHAKLTFSQMIADICDHLYHLICDNLCLVLVFLICFYPVVVQANPDIFIQKSALVWQADGKGDYTFEQGLLKGTAISQANTIIHSYEPGIFELKNSIATKGTIEGVTVSYEFNGEVKLEISFDDGLSYTPIINGVPLASGFIQGEKIKWRAYIAPDSELTRVKISYTDSSGVIGDFGNPELSGFKYRKSMSITGSDEALYNYQMKIQVSEGSQSHNVTTSPADVYCESKIENNFKDVRFTASDGLTSLQYYLEDITGNKPPRIATFWVKIPQLPKEGLAMYIYYGNNKAEELSRPDGVFDFYDDFKDDELNLEKWEVVSCEGAGYTILNSAIKLNACKILSKNFQLKDGIIEYRARPSKASQLCSIIKDKKDKESGELAQLVCSSDVSGQEHGIYIGSTVKASQPNGISANNYYNFRVTANAGQIIFERYPGSGFADSIRQARIDFEAKEGLDKGYIGLFARGNADTYYYWVRVRKLENPKVNITKTDKAELANLAQFQYTVIAANGDLTLKEKATQGVYTSPIMQSKFPVRIIKPSWSVGESGSDYKLTIDVSADKGITYKTGCQEKGYYYASLNDFKVGDNLVYKLNLTCDTKKCKESSPKIKQINLDYSAGNISLLSPNGNETWAMKSQKQITWKAADYGPSYKFNLEYSLDAGDSFNVIAKGIENSGTYSWALCDIPTTKARVRITDAANPGIFDTSDGNFTIGTQEDEDKYKATGQKEETKEESKEAKKEELKPEGKKAGYEFLVRVKDKASGATKRGDCITFQEAGWNWSDDEKKHFAIISVMDITYAQAQELCSNKYLEPKLGEKIIKNSRKYKFDLDSFPGDLKNKWLDENQAADVVQTDGADVK